jgi:hypothetical protein
MGRLQQRSTNDPALIYPPSSAIVAMQFYTVEIHNRRSPITQEVWMELPALINSVTSSNMADIRYLRMSNWATKSGDYIYFDNVKVGTTDGATDIFSDDRERGTC